MKSYTLEQLALFDRCLCRDDFKKDLILVGASAEDAKYISDWQHNNKAGIVNIYQNFACGTSNTDSILSCNYNKYLEEVIERFFIRSSSVQVG